MRPKTMMLGAVLLGCTLFYAGECRRILGVAEEGSGAVLPTEPDPPPPLCVAKIRGPLDVAGDFTVQLFDESDDCGQRLWQFGDGETSEVEKPIHAYPACGDYIATLEAWADPALPDQAQVPVSFECPEPTVEP